MRSWVLPDGAEITGDEAEVAAEAADGSWVVEVNLSDEPMMRVDLSAASHEDAARSPVSAAAGDGRGGASVVDRGRDTPPGSSRPLGSLHRDIGVPHSGHRRRRCARRPVFWDRTQRWPSQPPGVEPDPSGRGERPVELGRLGGLVRPALTIPGVQLEVAWISARGSSSRTWARTRAPSRPSAKGRPLAGREQIALEGGASRFPITAAAFSSVARLPDGGSWVLEWNPESLDTPVMGGMRLHYQRGRRSARVGAAIGDHGISGLRSSDRS